MSRHDQLFKDLLRTFFAGFLRLAVPGPAGLLDLTRISFLDKEAFTDWPTGERREVDLLATVPRQGAPRSLHLFHVEVEAEARAGMGRRLWDYDRQLHLRHGLPVHTILVTLRKGRPGLHAERALEKSLGFETGSFSYVALGLEGARAEDFLAFPEPPAWALAALMRSEGSSRAAHKIACKRPIAAATHLSELERFLLENFVETYVQLTTEEAAEYKQLCASEENREVRAMELTWADRMEAKYRREEARGLLLRQLERRFGSLPAGVRHGIEAIDSLDRLHRLADQILVASSLEEMGLG